MKLNQIDLNALVIFHTVVEHGSIQKAKDILARTQPAITLRLNKLEDDLGKKLFLQKKPALKLTPEGTVLYRWTTNLKRLLEKSPMVKSGELSDFQYPLRIGTYNNISAYCLPPAMTLTAQKFPDLMFSTNFNDPYELFQRLKMGSIDVVILPKNFNASNEIKKIFSIPQRYYAVVPNSMRHKNLGEMKWCFYRNPKDVHLQALNEVLLEYVPQPDIRWEISKLTSVSSALETQLAAAVVPSYFLCRKIDQCEVIPLKSMASKEIPMEGYVRADFASSPNAEPLKFFVQAFVQNLKQIKTTTEPLTPPTARVVES